MGVRSRFVAWSQDHRFTVDALTAAAVALVVVPTSRPWRVLEGPLAQGAGTALVSAVMVAAMAWRRVSPVACLAVVYSAALLHVVAGAPMILPADLVVPWALWAATVHGPRWAGRLGIAAALVGSVVVGVLTAWDRGDAAVLSLVVALCFVTVWSMALAHRARREALDSLVDRAHQLEVERDRQAQLAAADERARIAREMHDIVAHSLTVMIAQADGGRYAAAADPNAATRALGTIAETGRAALTDMRRLLGVLRAQPGGAARATDSARPSGASDAGIGPPTAIRESSGPGALPTAADVDEGAAMGPLPALDDVGTLVERLRANGLRVSMVRLGPPRNLPPGIGLTVYRIAQESLTNVLKHAGPDPEVTLVLQWLPASVALTVQDDGRGASADSDGLGQGVLGMRERAAMFGGELVAGPRPGGGFQVRVSLPTPPVPRSGAPAPSTEGVAS